MARTHADIHTRADNLYFMDKTNDFPQDIDFVKNKGVFASSWKIRTDFVNGQRKTRLIANPEVSQQNGDVDSRREDIRLLSLYRVTQMVSWQQ